MISRGDHFPAAGRRPVTSSPRARSPGSAWSTAFARVDGAGGHGAGCGRDLRGGGQVMVVVLGHEETEIHDGHRLLEAGMARHARQLRRRPAGQPIDDFRSCSAKCGDQIARRLDRCAWHRASGGSGGRPGGAPGAPARSRPGGLPRGPRGRAGARHVPARTSARRVCRSGWPWACRRAGWPGDRGPRAAARAAGAPRWRAVPSRRCGRTSVSRTEMLVRSQAVRNKRCGAVVKTSASARGTTVASARQSRWGVRGANRWRMTLRERTQ